MENPKVERPAWLKGAILSHLSRMYADGVDDTKVLQLALTVEFGLTISQAIMAVTYWRTPKEYREENAVNHGV